MGNNAWIALQPVSQGARIATGLGIALLVFAVPGGAQESALEEIVVTGTRIARPDFESASPVVVLPAVAFARTGSSTVETRLNQLPLFVPGETGTSNGASDGEATLDLRGLRPTRTLVLLDGRRMVPVNGDGYADVNVIPSSLIESVDVVTGGASAVYGSDAISGVVNFRLRDEFDGIEVGGRWGQTGRGDGDEYEVSVTAGTPFAEGRGSVLGFVGYSDRSQVNLTDRHFARAPTLYLGAGNGDVGPGNSYIFVGSSSTDEGYARFLPSEAAFESLFAAYGYTPGSVPYQNEYGFNSDGSIFTMGDTETRGSVANFRGGGDPLTTNDFRHSYNFNTLVALQMPLERTHAFVSSKYEFDGGTEAFAQVIYSDYSVTTQLAPTPIQRVYMPATNPYIPVDLQFLLDSREFPDEPFEFRKRATEIGPRNLQNDYDMYQAVAGLRGQLPRDWAWDAYVQYGASGQHQFQTGNVSRTRVLELVFAEDGGLSICGGFSPFGVGSILPACADYIEADARLQADVSQFVAEATVHGTLLELPAGPLRTVFGVQHRRNTYEVSGNEAFSALAPDGGPDVVGFTAGSPDIDADDENTDFYVEAALPLLADLPGALSLETVLGYRHSDYASAGGVDTWKAELLYSPAETLRLRGSYQRAVRVPSLLELYSPRYDDLSFFFPEDPCSAGSAQRTGGDAGQVESLCVAQGLPTALLDTFYSDEFPTTFGGNPDLGPEQADTLTAGFVINSKFESRWLAELQLSVDWYRIELEDAITGVAASDAVLNCFDGELNPGYDPGSFWCSLFARDTATGEIAESVDTLHNLATTATSGIDFVVDWHLPVGPGEIGVDWVLSWVDSFEIVSAPGVPSEEFAGTVGGFAGSYPEWKWMLGLRYTWRNLDAGVRWRYVDSMQDGARVQLIVQDDYVVPHQDYFDVDVGYEFQDGWFDGLALVAGIENLTDEQPPWFPSAPLANTDTSQYDVLGRRFFVRVTMRL